MMKRSLLTISLLTLVLCLPLSAAIPERTNTRDAYEVYVRTSRDFRSVRQDKDWALKAWPSWTYMPWYYQWTLGFNKDGGAFSKEHGYNGAFVDRGASGRLDWIDQYGLRFYMDHTAGKGDLHLWDGNGMKPHASKVHGSGVRVRPVNTAMKGKLEALIRRSIGEVKSSPNRAAYALDDELSWGHFVHPCMWRITDNKAAYTEWLREIYGAEKAPIRGNWITYEAIRPHLSRWSLREFDASPLMDQWSFNDSYWCNFLGSLVEFANRQDPDTPCGFVGGQSPNAFGGYDYAKLMRKIQFIEAYNLGSSQAVIRSFNPRNALPTVTTHFHKRSDDTIWQTWYYLAHGNRGFIGWVEKWFDGNTPRTWHAEVAPHYLEAGKTIGPLMSGAEWMHDCVAIYYNHASIQLGWILDAEAHGKTWVNRNGDHRLGGAHLVRKAWENMLRDEGLQYNFLSYVDIIQKGVPREYKVLILPACLCLSDVEATRIQDFCRNGGTVIADYLPGLWDQHGKGRPEGGVLDSLFGVDHDPGMKAADVFQERLWCEVDQDANFYWKRYDEMLTKHNTCLRDASGYHKVVRAMGTDHVRRAGKGTAVLMNLSPQWYSAYRLESYAKAGTHRDVFLKHVRDSGARPWVRISDPATAAHGYEITYWGKGTRTILFVCFNPEVEGSMTGGGNSAGLKTDAIPITLAFETTVRNVRNERTGKPLGDGKTFKLNWVMNEALVLSFD